MKKLIILSILLILNLYSNDKVICNKLTNVNYDFLGKITTTMKNNIQYITMFNSTKDNFLNTLNVDNNRIDICEYQSNLDENIISYLIYSNTKNIFINDKAIQFTNIDQGLSFRYLSYKNNNITLYYETSGGSSQNYHYYKFIFSKYKNDFKLIKATKNYTIVVPDGFDLKSQEIILKDTYLSNFDIKKYIKEFDEIYMQPKQIQPKKQPLYKTPPEKTKMYLIKGDKVEILEEKDDWLYILYRGKKDIKAWIPKSAVEDK